METAGKDIDIVNLIKAEGIDVATIEPGDVVVIRPKTTPSRHLAKWLQDSVKRLNRSEDYGCKFLFLPPEVDAGIVRQKDKDSLYNKFKRGEL